MGIRETIVNTVMSWPGVTERPHRFGGIQFSLGERELGHLHGDRMADLPFTRAVHDELIATGRAQAARMSGAPSGAAALVLVGPSGALLLGREGALI